MKKYKVGILALMALGLSATSASALYIADLTYDYVANAGDNYTFDVTVRNASTAGDTGGLDFFMIDLDADAFNLYSNVTWETDQGWFDLTAEYDPSFGTIPASAWADDAAVYGGGGGIAQGDSLTFSLSFDYTGNLAADAQVFSWYAEFGTWDDGQNFGTLGDDFGNLTYEDSGSAPVPEPATMLLFGTGLAGLLGAGRKKMKK